MRLSWIESPLTPSIILQGYVLAVSEGYVDSCLVRSPFVCDMFPTDNTWLARSSKMNGSCGNRLRGIIVSHPGKHPQISFTNPTSTKLSNGILIYAIFVLLFSRTHKKAIKRSFLTIFVPFLIFHLLFAHYIYHLRLCSSVDNIQLCFDFRGMFYR